MIANHRLCHHRRKKRHRIGQAGCIGSQAPKRRDVTAFALPIKIVDRRTEIATDGAA
jgi:hypothetical protein